VCERERVCERADVLVCSICSCGRFTERERERGRERERQRERQTDRERDRQTERERMCVMMC